MRRKWKRNKEGQKSLWIIQPIALILARAVPALDHDQAVPESQKCTLVFTCLMYRMLPHKEGN